MHVNTSHRCSSSGTMVASETTSAVQTLHDYVYDPSYITKLMTRKCSCSDITSKTALGWHYKLCSTSDTDEVRRTGFLPCRSCCMELATEWTSTSTYSNSFKRNFKTHLFSTAFSLFLLFILFYQIDSCNAPFSNFYNRLTIKILMMIMMMNYGDFRASAIGSGNF